MKAFLLATSEKNPLAQIEQQLPSPMIPVLNRPVMLHAVELLYRYDIRDIYVNLYNFGEKIEQYFETGRRWGINVTYLLQHQPYGSAGAIRRAKHHLDETFLVLPADLIIDVDLTAALEFHRVSGNIATMILQSPSGEILCQDKALSRNSDGSILFMGESPSPEQKSYCDTGVYIFEPEILEYIPGDKIYHCATDLIPALLNAREPIAGFVTDGYWNPLDSFGAYQHAQSTLFKQMMSETDELGMKIMPPYGHGLQEPAGVWRGRNVQIHPTAHIHPPVYIGEGSQILTDTEIGPNAVLGSYVVVGRNTSIKNSTVFNSTLIGTHLDIESKIVNKNILIDTKLNDIVQMAEPLILADVSPTYFPNLLWVIFEKCISMLLLFWAAPIMLLIGLSIWATSGGPIMTTVQRIGPKPEGVKDPSLSGPQILSLTRFRTRNPDGSQTEIGQWLEGWELHRLPELWNVLTGAISLVGVEPLSIEESYLVEKEWQLQRYKCKAGFTGFWYTQTTATSDFVERCVVDVYYAVTRRFSLDVQQLLLTPAMWVRRRRWLLKSQEDKKSNDIGIKRTNSPNINRARSSNEHSQVQS